MNEWNEWISDTEAGWIVIDEYWWILRLKRLNNSFHVPTDTGFDIDTILADDYWLGWDTDE